MSLIRPCPVCGSQSASALYAPPQSPGPISACRKCGMVYVATVDDSHALILDGPVLYDESDPSICTTDRLEEVQDQWEMMLLGEKEHEWPALRQNAFDALDRIERHLNGRKPGRLLDFGSGWGFFLAAAQERGWTPCGLEPLPGPAAYTRATFAIPVTADTLHADSFEPDSIDAITSFQVFEHLPFPAADVVNLCRMLKSGGLITIEVPNINTWTVRLMKERHRHFVQDHINFFSADTLTAFLTRYGLEVVEHYYPTRRMSMRYMVNQWFPRFLPEAAVRTSRSLLTWARIWEGTIRLNLGDIIAVIARKP